ncbi:ABC transporter substrate-binding protein [Thermoactinomyces sp. CICC 10521]|uniref:ABC transporter substrate-binding protein n=1 Tax=Thermoactinomyces sp. CICC 10521 TaxID=2767426 RepID=UPI0018DC474E|nr:ABC transporter substrate-binding protein [Thermoactinomyces sp. CICC 10521]MBH8608761.1 ABC transporter substrate-binding protein [Thermoactinomyces sp. CICC 10521]
MNQPIRLGFAGALSGERTAQTSQFVIGGELAVEHLQHRYSQKIIVNWKDDMARADRAIEVAHHFVKQRVDGVVGHFSSECALAAANIYRQHGIPLIAPASTHPLLSDYSNVFRLSHNDDTVCYYLASWLLKKVPLSSLLLVRDESLYSHEYITRLKFYLSTLTANTVDVFYFNPYSETKLPLTTKQTIFFCGRTHRAIQLINLLEVEEKKVDVYFSDDAYNQEFLDNVSYPNIHVISSGPIPKTERTHKFHHDYELRAQGKPGFFAAAMYAGVEIIVQAFHEKVKTSSDLIHLIKTKKWPTLLGEVKFTTTGDFPHQNIGIWKIENKKFVPTDTIHFR